MVDSTLMRNNADTVQVGVKSFTAKPETASRNGNGVRTEQNPVFVRRLLLSRFLEAEIWPEVPRDRR